MSHKGTFLRLGSLVSVSLMLSLVSNADTLFSPPQNYPVGSSPNSVAVGDVNNDGRPDLVVTQIFGPDGQGSVTVFLGNGDGAFHPLDTFGSGAGFATSVAIADLNGDRKLDLVVTNCGDTSNPGDCPNPDGSHGVVAIFLGNGNGTFQAPTLYDSGAPTAGSVVAADLNLDGIPDVVFMGGGGPQVMLGNGDGTFQPIIPYNGAGDSSVAVADVNRDGKPDLVVQHGGGMGTLLGNGDGTFRVLPPQDIPGSNLVVSDVNGDGKPDLIGVITCSNSITSNFCDYSSVSVSLGSGDGTFQPRKLFASGGQSAVSVALADVNGDSKPDVVVANCSPAGHLYLCELTSKSFVSVRLGNGDGTFKGAVNYSSGGNQPRWVFAGDVNGDSRPDIVVANYFSSDIGVLLNEGPFPTLTLLESSPNPSIYGQRVTFKATVTSHSPTTPTGSVSFRWTQYGQSHGLATAVLNGDGIATIAKASLNASQYAMTAVYKGDPSNGVSTSGVLNQLVKQTSTAATIVSSLNPSSQGQPVTFTAKITSPTVIVSGPVTFTAGGAVLGTVQLSGGRAQLTTSVLGVGSSKITVTYLGNSNVAKSSASVTQTVH
jgi:hypothetical protein